MIVSIKPPNREEYPLLMSSPPVYSSSIAGGYELAEIYCELDGEERVDSIGARLRVHGDTGIVWQGIVTRRPGKSTPLEAKGWGIAGTYGRRAVVYADNSLSAWEELNTSAVTNNPMVTAGVDGEQIVFLMDSSATVYGTKACVWRTIPQTNSSVVKFHYSMPPNTSGGLAYGTSSGGAAPGVWTTVWQSSASSSGDASATINASHNALLLYAWPIAHTPGALEILSYSSLVVFGASGVTNPTTTNVIKDVVSVEVVPQKWAESDYFMPSGTAYLAWIDSDSDVIIPCIYDSCTANAKTDYLAGLSKYCFGWYTERVGNNEYCLPHWYLRSTTPDYIVKLWEADDYDLEESTLEEMCSAVRVNYTTLNGSASWVDVLDTDTTHPLVRMGVTRYTEMNVGSASAADASAFGEQALEDLGRMQTKGQVTTTKAYTGAGVPVYLPDIRPGKMMRVFGLNGYTFDSVVRRIECTSDTSVNIELDNEPYDMDLYLAKLSNSREGS